MMSYQKNPRTIDEDDTDVPLVTTIHSSTKSMTMGHRLSKRMIAIVAVAGMMMMLMMADGGTVWMRATMDAGRTTMTTAEGLVVGTEGNKCFPTGGTFNGISTTTLPSQSLYGRDKPFQTCYQFGLEKRLDYTNYCWTNSFSIVYYGIGYEKGYHYQCVPDGPYVNGVVHVDPKRSWHTVKAVKPQTSLPSCGRPCPGQHECYGDDCAAP